MIRDQVRENWRDVEAFGWGVLFRHLRRFDSSGLRRASLKGVGQVALRPHQSDMSCIRQVFREREYDLSRQPLMQARVDAALSAILGRGGVPVIIDGGANIGAASLWFAQRYPEAKVVAVEPDGGNYAVLCENVASISNVLPIKGALGSESGYVEVVSPGLGWDVQTVRAQAGLPVLTIEDCVKRVPGGELFIVKIDIEGFESDLFAANTEWIDQTQLLLIEPHDWLLPGQFTSRNFMKSLAPRPFEVVIVGGNMGFVR